MTLSLDRILALPCIGEGNFRRVYSDGVTVFKIEHGEGIDLACNQGEIDGMETLRSLTLPDNVRVPAAYLYVTDGIPVVAMQYIDGELMGECTCVPGESHFGCLPETLERQLNEIGYDTAFGNVIARSNFYYLIDLDGLG